jgi:hypothetical protein
MYIAVLAVARVVTFSNSQLLRWLYSICCVSVHKFVGLVAAALQQQQQQ